MLAVMANLLYCQYCPSGRRYVSPLTISFQAMRAILLASATATISAFSSAKAQSAIGKYVCLYLL